MLSSDESTCSVYRYPLPCIPVFLLRASICATPPSIMLAPSENSIVVAEKPPALSAAPQAAIDAPAVKKEPTMAAAPSTICSPPFPAPASRGTIWMTAPHPEVREDGRTPPPVPCPHREYVSGTSLRSSDGGIPAPVTTAPGWLPLPCSRTG